MAAGLFLVEFGSYINKYMTESEFKIQLNKSLFSLADLMIIYYDPCQFKKGNCVEGNYRCCAPEYGENICQNLSETGCLKRNTMCRIWLCQKARENSPDCGYGFS